MSLSKFINASENRYGIGILTMDNALDDQSMAISSEEIVKTTDIKKKKVKKSKSPNPKWFRRLIDCLDEGHHDHMLSYVPGSNKSIFYVVFIDKKNKTKWSKKDISLFKDMDSHIGNVFNRKRSVKKIEEDVKVRFKSNMCKCVKQGFIEQIGEKKIQKYKTVKYYKILWRPQLSVGENSNDRRVKRNKGKSNRKGYEKNGNKESNVSRRNFQEENANPESFPRVDNHEIMDSETTPQVGNNEIMNLENIPQMGNDEIKNFESMTQSKMHFESVPYVDNIAVIFQHAFEEKHMNLSHYLCLPFNSQSKIDENERMNLDNLKTSCPGRDFDLNCDSKIDENEHKNLRAYSENLKTSCPGRDFDLKCDSKIDENEHMNLRAYSENLKTSCPGGHFDLNCDPNTFDLSVYDPVKIFCGNSDINTSISDQTTEETNLNVINCGGSENEGNEYIQNNGKYIVEDEEYLKEADCNDLGFDPFMCGGQFETLFSPLGASDDWSCIYQQLN